MSDSWSLSAARSACGIDVQFRMTDSVVGIAAPTSIGHNRNVRSVSRDLLRFALAAHVGLMPTFAQEHRHESGAAHSQAVIHRHLAAHDHDGAEVSDEEGRIVWLDDDIGLPTGEYRLALHVAVDTGTYEEAVQRPSWVAIPSLDSAPAHGPPKRAPQSLRAPPPSV